MMKEMKLCGFFEESNGSQTIYVNGHKYVGEWIEEYGISDGISLMNNHFIHTIIAHLRCELAVIQVTVGHFTNLLDKNGKEIYENDLVTNRMWSGKFIVVGGTRCLPIWEEIEIIETIFDKEVEE